MPYIQDDFFGQGKAIERFYPQTAPLTRPDRGLVAQAMKEKAAGYLRSGYFDQRRKGERIRDEADRFAVCGDHHVVWQCPDDLQLFSVPVSCHSRICEPCAKKFYFQIRDSMEDIIKPLFAQKRKGFGVFLLTLTTNTKRYAGAAPTREHIRRLYDESTNFFRLYYGKYQAKTTKNGKIIEDQSRYTYQTDVNGTRKKTRNPSRSRLTRAGKEVQDYRRYRGAGFISTIEVGHNNNNLHIHAVVYGPYIPIRKLSASWKQLTGDSMVVDIKAVYRMKTAIWYVMKYIVKPPSFDGYHDLANYAEMIKGSRRLRAGGIFYDRIKRAPRPKLKFGCPYCSSRLENISIGHLDDAEKECAPSLYKLLRLVAERGSPLPRPGPATTLDERVHRDCLERQAAGIVTFPVN